MSQESGFTSAISMPARGDFWMGFATGTLIGMVAAVYAKWDFKRPESGHGEKPAFDPAQIDHSFRAHSEEILLRREASENSGDPTRLTPSRMSSPAPSQTAGHALNISRSGGAPGSRTAAEVIEIPGHPGQTLDLSDPSQPVRAAARALDLTTPPRR